MRLCMFHPNDHPLERGWVGRVDGDRVLHLAAQTLQSFFLGGSGAREHAEYPLADVTLLVPVQAADGAPLLRVRTPSTSRTRRRSSARTSPVAAPALTACARVAAVIGAEGEIGGFSALLEWQDPAESPAVKQSDFGLVLGPVVVTPDEIDPERRSSIRVDGGGSARGRRRRRRSTGPMRSRSPPAAPCSGRAT